jgi:translation initiation factor 2 subunit 3
MYVARSFDVNKPGTDYKKLVGGVFGGSIVQGKLSEGAEVTISPGVLHQTKAREYYEPISTKIVALHAGGQHAKEAFPGGLIGVSTELDPSLAKSDSLVGCVLGEKNSLPPVWNELAIEVMPLKRVIESFSPSIAPTEPVVVGVGTATTIGFPSAGKKGVLHLTLKKPVCANKGDRVALMRRVNNRWRLYAAGKIV